MNLFEQDKLSITGDDVIKEELRIEYSEELWKITAEPGEFDLSLMGGAGLKTGEKTQLEQKINLIEKLPAVKQFAEDSFKREGYDLEYIGFIDEEKKERLNKYYNNKEERKFGDFDNLVSFLNDFYEKKVENGLFEEMGESLISKTMEYESRHNKDINQVANNVNERLEATYGVNVFEAFDIMYRKDMLKYDENRSLENRNSIDRACYGNKYLEEVIPDIMLDLEMEIDKINKRKEIIDKERVYNEIEDAIKACRVVDEEYKGLLPKMLDNFFKKMEENRYFSDKNIDAREVTQRINGDLFDTKNLFTYLNTTRTNSFGVRTDEEIKNDISAWCLIDKIGKFWDEMHERYKVESQIDFGDKEKLELVKDDIKDKNVEYIIKELEKFKEGQIRNDFKNRVDNLVKEIGDFTRFGGDSYYTHNVKNKRP